MGGQSVLNAAKELTFIRGVAALAAYDIGAAFRYGMEKELRSMIETKGQCLNISSASELYQNALAHRDELGNLNNYERLSRHNILFVEASLDKVAPADKMMLPLYEKLSELSATVAYKTIVSAHNFTGQRMKLAKTVADWIENTLK